MHVEMPATPVASRESWATSEAGEHGGALLLLLRPHRRDAGYGLNTSHDEPACCYGTQSIACRKAAVAPTER